MSRDRNSFYLTRIKKLETALIEYVGKYGMTPSARSAFFGEDERPYGKTKSADSDRSNVIYLLKARPQMHAHR